MPQHANRITAALFVFMIFFLGVYDLVVGLRWGHTATVSHVVQRWAREFPVLTLLIGLILGHLFWPIGEE